MRMNILLKALTALTAGVLVLSCSKTEEEDTLVLSSGAANFTAVGAGAQTVNVTSNTDWTVSCSESWVSIDPAAGKKDGSFKIAVQDNPTFSERTADVVVTAGALTQTVKVAQLALTPELAVLPTSIEVEAAGGEQALSVSSNADWTVTIPAAADWITASAKSGSGNGTVTLTFAANPTFEVRTAEVTVTGEGLNAKIAVSQAALTPEIAIEPSVLSLSNDAESKSVTVSSNTAWTVSVPSDCDWISVNPTSGSGNATISVNAEKNRALTARSTEITVTETTGNNSVTLTVNQAEGQPSRYTDSLALVAIYNASNGANWKSDRVWDLSKAMDDADGKWYGVTLNAEGRVSALKLLKATITEEWTIPAEIGNLTEITDLRFIDCKVAGTFPTVLYNLTKLVSLYLTNNTVAFTLSADMAKWTELKDLYIDQNANVQGSLPKEIGTMTKLANINISKTSVSGAIPAEMSGCSALLNLMAYSTNINAIPDNWDQWPALKIIQLYDNAGLTGTLPASVGNATKLTSVWFYGCNFTGNVPESYANLPATCKQLRVQNNKMTGVVPSAVQGHANWTTWKASQYILPQQDGYGLTLE